MPAQTGPEGDVEITTAGVSGGLTTTLNGTEVTVDGTAQEVLDVIWTVTISPFIKVDELKVDEFVPTLMPFNFHW
ncbi:MAG TPA: hypothetical protein VEB42_02605 [Chitinophagaceae bacterium]|nr:hypothetical protein [Chitinophagaceae bacterium]